MLQSKPLKFALGTVALACCVLTLPSQAQMAQKPLLSSASPVEPNIVFMLDDSSSMPGQAVYQYGGVEGVYGMSGPGSTNGNTLTTNEYASQSPDVNLIYYDPRVTYKRRVNANGTSMAAGTFNDNDEFNVYFYSKGGTYRVTSVTLVSGGIYASVPAPSSFKFPNAPTGGTTAVVSVTTAGGTSTTRRVSGVSIDNAKRGNYSSCPLPNQVSFTGASPSGTGSVAASVTAVGCQTFTNGIVSVDTNNSNTFPAACTTTGASVTLRNGGTGAAVAVTIGTSGGNKVVSSFTVTDPGNGFSSNSASIRVTCSSTSRDYNVTRTSGTRYRVNSVTVAPSYGYSAAPTIVFPAASPSQQTASGTVNLDNAWRVTGVGSVNAGNKGYTTYPELTNVPAGLLNAEFDYNYAFDPGAVGVNARWDGTGSATAVADYFTFKPTGFNFEGYLPDAGSPLASGAQLIPYPNTAKKSVTTKYPKFINRDDCAAATHCTWDEERQNYANWKLYHSDRLEIAKTGLGLAFQPLSVASGQAPFRLGWGTINRITDSSALDAGVRPYTTTIRDNFFTWLYQDRTLKAATPNKTALNKVGSYFERGDNDGPWGNNPSATSTSTNAGTTKVATHASCRRSYALLMTDGYYGDTVSVGDWDTTARTLTMAEGDHTYTPIGPYSDTKNNTKISNTLADVAAKYYLSDLRDDLANNVRKVTGDDAYWQHLNFYAIGLGVNGKLDASSPAVLQSLTGAVTRTKDWETPSNTSRSSIDDMWHATINGHGQMLSAKTSDELSDAISKMISDISGKEGTQAGVAASAVSLTQGTKKYTPGYTPVSWQGSLTAYRLNKETGEEAGIAWAVETEISGTSPVQYISTIPQETPTVSTRKMFAGNGATSGTRAVNFTYAGLGGTLRGQMGSSTVVTEDLIKYLRGDATNEGTLYRKRATRLGDIVNSTPVFVKGTLDMKYNLLPDGTAGRNSYTTYLTAKQSRAEGVIVVGANDGALHVFRDGTYDPATDATLTQGGAEIFAYVPYAVLPKLSDLASKSYTHRYYVDGPNVEADAFIGGAWKNIVIGSTGGGAGVDAVSGTSPRSSVFAINMTKLNTGVTGLDASDVLWEVGSWQPDFLELGHVLQDVQTGITTGGEWVAVFGNGYGSKSCKAQLFVVRLSDGSLLQKIDTGEGSGACNSSTNTNANGLGSVRLVRNATQQIIGAYAGDLKGNMWRFDLSSASPGSWTKSKLLSPATTTQPITAAPSVIGLPMAGTAKPAPGYMVVFGTGKFFEETDKDSANQQRLYGIYDSKLFGETPAATVNAASTTLLVEQTISAGGTDSGRTFFKVSNETVEYEGTAPKRGWFIKLTNSDKQRLIYPTDLLIDRFVLANTMAPEGVPTDPCSSEFGGVGYLYLLDALNGGGPLEATIDTNDNGNIGPEDLVVAGVQTQGAGRNVSLEISERKYANVGAKDRTLLQPPCVVNCSVPSGTYQRQWRQLFLR